MWVEVKNFVRTCAGCQRAARNDNSRAPLQTLPCVSEPFEKVAFDLVGPLPKTSGGHRYFLTMMCLYTKYPEAIPLRRVDQETVLEAMLEVFSRHGLPKTILTDQGSVFMSKLTTKLWETLGVHRVRTSPYHPQSDGALERWHACLKGMLKKADKDIKYWDRHLKFLLFAYRDTPHCVTGFSPFTLLFIHYFRPYLLGHPCLVYTDHAACLSILNTARPSGKLARWALTIQEMDITIKHKSGKRNTNADALSRCPADESRISAVRVVQEDEVSFPDLEKVAQCQLAFSVVGRIQKLQALWSVSTTKGCVTR